MSTKIILRDDVDQISVLLDFAHRDALIFKSTHDSYSTKKYITAICKNNSPWDEKIMMSQNWVEIS